LERTNYSTGTKWEAAAGYSRAVRVGNHIWVAGTTATGPDGKITALGDHHGQTLKTLENISFALTKVGGGLKDVVRTRIYLVDIEDHFADVARAHLEVFGEILPVSMMIGVTGFATKEMLVEIEAEAVITGRV